MTLDTREIWLQLHERLLGFIERRVGARAEAEDILQDVFSRVHANLGSLRDEARIKSWVYQITRNAIADHLRARGKVTMVPELPAAPAEDLEASGSQELASCIQPLLDALPTEYREALVLTELEGLTQRAAAERAGLSLSGMKSRVQRGRERLKQELLACCHVELDRRGGVADYEARDCAVCGSCCASPSSE